jgi:hypothetical protein
MIMKPVFSTLTFVLALGAAATTAAAEDVCMPAGEMKAALIDWYGERPVPGESQGSSQVWASSTTGTWSMVKFMGDGNACVTAQGDNWMAGLTGDEQIAALEADGVTPTRYSR